MGENSNKNLKNEIDFGYKVLQHTVDLSHQIRVALVWESTGKAVEQKRGSRYRPSMYVLYQNKK